MSIGSFLLLLAAAATTPPAPMSQETVTRLLEAFKAAADGSATMVTWALTAMIATIAAIVSTSYWRPARLAPRLTYWLYLPGWFFLAASIYYGDGIARDNISAHFNKPSLLAETAVKLVKHYALQQQTLIIGLAIFFLWLLLYLAWWIHGDWKTPNQ